MDDSVYNIYLINVINDYLHNSRLSEHIVKILARALQLQEIRLDRI